VGALEPDVPRAVVGLVEGRASAEQLLALDDVIDLVLPRGSSALVRHVQAHTRIPVLGHAEGVCHVYVDRGADLAQAAAIVVDAKADYPSACNAMETLLLHRALVRPHGHGICTHHCVSVSVAFFTCTLALFACTVVCGLTEAWWSWTTRWTMGGLAYSWRRCVRLAWPSMAAQSPRRSFRCAHDHMTRTALALFGYA
jgi:gamma-glutamyl phosphate reductase